MGRPEGSLADRPYDEFSRLWPVVDRRRERANDVGKKKGTVRFVFSFFLGIKNEPSSDWFRKVWAYISNSNGEKKKAADSECPPGVINGRSIECNKIYEFSGGLRVPECSDAPRRSRET